MAATDSSVESSARGFGRLPGQDDDLDRMVPSSCPARAGRWYRGRRAYLAGPLPRQTRPRTSFRSTTWVVPRTASFVVSKYIEGNNLRSDCSRAGRRSGSQWNWRGGRQAAPRPPWGSSTRRHASNILLDVGRPHLMNFLAEGAGGALTQRPMGTPDYEPRAARARASCRWSIRHLAGRSLRLLTERRPFRGSVLEVVEADARRLVGRQTMTRSPRRASA